MKGEENRDEPALHGHTATPSRFTERSLPTPELIGSNPKFVAVLEDVRTVAAADCAVLIQGETGTGKELIARAIHEASARRHHHYVAINCAAIPAALLESELFGYERGAFTGAIAAKMGRFQAADRGTLFLDEIGELPIELQPKLLRAIQEQEFERLGSSHTTRVDVRIVAATNQNLEQMVAERRFRMDLYYRLVVFPITLPAAARTDRRHSRARSSFRPYLCLSQSQIDRRRPRRGDDGAHRIRLARQHSGAAELHRALGHPDEGGGASSAGRRTRQQTPADSRRAHPGGRGTSAHHLDPAQNELGGWRTQWRGSQTRTDPDNPDRQDAEARNFA